MGWRSLDLFSGIGGWSLACHQQGIATAAACEIDEWKREQFAVHFPGVPIYADVCALTGRQVVSDVGSIDIVVGSPPCTDISTANSRGLGVDGDESRLYFEAVRLVSEIRPRWVAFENSANLRARGSDRVLAALEQAGYAPWPVVVGAVHAGAPHLRRRSWIVAADADCFGLRLVSGGGSRTRRSDLSSVAAIDAHADRQGQPHGAEHAEMGGSTGADGSAGHGAASADNASIGRRQRRSRRPDPGAAREQDEQRTRQAEDAANSNGIAGRTGTSGQDRAQTGDRIGDANCERLAVGEGFSGNDGEELAPAQRATHGGWRDRAASLARHLRMDDGVSSGMASADTRSWSATLARSRSAYGDAIVPAVGSAVLAGIIAADRYLRDAA